MQAIKNLRLKGYDYKSNGFYFVTIVAHNRRKLFQGRMKDVVAQLVGRLSETTGVRIDYSVVMDDHVHFIAVLDGCRWSIGEIVRQFKGKATQAAGFKLWQPNYYEHVIRSEKALAAIREYIANNPLAEKIEWESIYKGAQRVGRLQKDRANTNVRSAH